LSSIASTYASNQDDQAVNVDLREARAHAEAGLPATNHEHGRIAVGIFAGDFSQIEPVGPAEIARIGFAHRSRAAHMLLVSLDLVERREQRPCVGARAIARIGGEAQNPAAAALAGLELKDRLDRVGTRAAYAARRGAPGSNRKRARPRCRAACFQLRNDVLRTNCRGDGPRERQHVTPIAFVVKKRIQRSIVRRGECMLELGEPALHRRNDIFCSREHPSCNLLPLHLSANGRVMAGLVPANHVLMAARRTRMPGTRSDMMTEFTPPLCAAPRRSG
jgi:hypothetical protein